MILQISFYRSKNNELIEKSNVRFLPEDYVKQVTEEPQESKYLLFLDLFINFLDKSIKYYKANTQYAQKFGLGYFGNEVLHAIIIEKEDNLYITKQEFDDNIKTKFHNVAIFYEEEILNTKNK